MVDRLNNASSPDLARHFRMLAKVAWPALLIGLFVGAVTMIVISRESPVYRAVVTAQIDPQVPVMPGDAYLYQLNAPYLALITSQTVRDSIATKMGPAWDAARVAQSVDVGVSQSPLIINVSGTAPDRAEAIALATSTVQALDEAARAQRLRELDRSAAGPAAELAKAREQLNDYLRSQGGDATTSGSDDAQNPLETQVKDLQAEVNRIRFGGVNGLSVLSVPTDQDVPRVKTASPSVAMFAGLVAFIVAAECLVLARGRFGHKLTGAGAERVAHRHGFDLELVDSSLDVMPPVTQGVVAQHTSRGEHVLVLRTLLAEPVVDRWLISQVAPQRITVEVIGTNWTARLAGDIGLAVVCASQRGEIRKPIAEAVKTLEDLNIPGRLVLVPPTTASRHQRRQAVSDEVDTTTLTMPADR